MKTCILIGGGNTISPFLPYETKEIDERIVKEAKKDNPIFLFVGLASNHSDSDYDHIKKIYQNLNCKTEYLKKKNIINNPDIVKDKIDRADIIYIGGGDTLKLIETIKEYQIDTLLKEAYKKGTILVGMSAGAILLSKEGFSDSYILRGESDHYQFIKGLDFVNLNIIPHYKDSEQKQKELIEELKENPKEVIGIQNGTALIIHNQKTEIIKANPDHTIYTCKYQNKFIEEEIKKQD